jgi:ABC-2 type transport system ATP-binding protein
MSGLAKPSEGRVSILDAPVRRNPSIYRRIGVMTEHEAIYDFLTGRQFVEFNARLQGLDDVEAAVDRAIDQVDLAGDQDRRMGGYSRGMRQRMRLAATMVHDPEVLLLDEPLSGTDPRQRLRFIDIVRRLGAEGRTVLISSHILEEVEAAADRIVLLIAGKVAASGDYRTIRRKLNDRPYVVRVTSSDPRALGAGLLRIGAVESVALDEDNHLRVRSLDVAALQRALPGVAQRGGIRLLRVEPLDDTLESVFEYLAEQ